MSGNTNSLLGNEQCEFQTESKQTFFFSTSWNNGKESIKMDEDEKETYFESKHHGKQAFCKDCPDGHWKKNGWDLKKPEFER